jgi:hypothetical protein
MPARARSLSKTTRRPYDAGIVAAGDVACATFAGSAPDVVPSGAEFRRDVCLPPGARAFAVRATSDFGGAAATDPQRAVSVTSLSVGNGSDMTTRRVLVPADVPFSANATLRVTAGHALAFYDTASHELATVAWRAGDVEDAAVLEQQFSLVARLTLARARPAQLRFGYEAADDVAAARALLARADRAAQEPASFPQAQGSR